MRLQSRFGGRRQHPMHALCELLRAPCKSARRRNTVERGTLDYIVLPAIHHPYWRARPPMTIRKIRCSWVSLLVFWCVSATTASAQDVFVRPPELEPAIAFWRNIYTSVGTDGGVLHD